MDQSKSGYVRERDIVYPHLIYTDCLHSLVETERLEDTETLKMVIKSGGNVGTGQEKEESVRKEIKEENGEARNLWDTEMGYYLLTMMCFVSTGLV